MNIVIFLSLLILGSIFLDKACKAAFGNYSNAAYWGIFSILQLIVAIYSLSIIAFVFGLIFAFFSVCCFLAVAASSDETLE